MEEKVHNTRSGWRQILAWLSALILVIGLACARRSAPLVTDISHQKWESHISELIMKAHIPGLSIAVIRDGKVAWTGAFGIENISTGEPCDKETVFEAASLTKPLFAYLVMQVAAEGKLDLDKSLIEYLSEQVVADSLLKHPFNQPGFRFDWFRKITGRQILSHSSGMPHGESADSCYPLLFEPGTQHKYSADGYYYLQLVLEKIEGAPLEKIAQRRALDPLGMTHSSLVWRDNFEETAANGHNMFGDPKGHRRWSRARAPASMYTTAEDYALFVCEILNRAHEADPMITKMLTSQIDIDVDDHLSWSLGFGRQKDENGSAFWQWGDYGIFRNFIIAYEESRSGVVWLTNSYYGLSVLDDLITECVGGNDYVNNYIEADSYDSPNMRFTHIAMENGIDAAISEIPKLRSGDSPFMDEGTLSFLCRELLYSKRSADAIPLYKFYTEEYPNSSDAWEGYAYGCLKGAQFDSALTYYSRALELNQNSRTARNYVDWIMIELEARDGFPELNHAYLAKFAGQYGPRQIRLQNDTLYYKREGAGAPERYLYPLKLNLFGLQGSPDWRFRFETDENRNVIAIEGLTANGVVDRQEKVK